MAISQCTISASLRNLTDAAPADIEDAKLYIMNKSSYQHDGKVIGPFEVVASFDAAGDVSVAVNETATPAKKLHAMITFKLQGITRTILFDAFEVPNEATAELSELTSPSEISQ